MRHRRAGGPDVGVGLDAARALVTDLAPLGGQGWIVGGGLRDALLVRPVADVDVALVGDARRAAKVLARAVGGSRYELSPTFGAWRVHGGALRHTVDVTPLQGATIEEDLARRDLTVNAMALPLGGGDLVDPHGGLVDLGGRTLRMVGPTAFSDDPVRILRLARQAQQLGFAVDPATRDAARAGNRLLWECPPERLLDELGRIAALEGPAQAFRVLDDLGALGRLVPELEAGRDMPQGPGHHLDVLGHTLETVRAAASLADDPAPFGEHSAAISAHLATPLADGLSRRDGLVLGALLHDVGKPETAARRPDGRPRFPGHSERGAEITEALLRRLRSSRRLREHLVHLVRHHRALADLSETPRTPRDVYVFRGRTAPATIDLVVLSIADFSAARGRPDPDGAIAGAAAISREVLTQVADFDRGAELPPLIAGDDLAAALGRPPGPWLAVALERIREAQIVDGLRTADDAIALVRTSSNV